MFSIIMPAYNRAHFISRAIQSVLAQTWQQYELLIIDDGSKDSLAETVAPYLSDRIHYYPIRHVGQTAARNVGLAKAKYPWIAYLDTDNQWHPEYLETMYRAAAGNGSNYEAAYCQASVFRKHPETGRVIQDGTVGRPFDFKALLRENYIDMNTFVHSAKVLRYAGTFDKLKRLSDWDLVLRITALFEPVFVPRTLVDYYLGVAENTATLTHPLETSLRIVTNKVRKYRQPVTIVHDTVPYTWQQLPPKKYLNWVRMQHTGLYNTDDYTAWGYPYIIQIEPTNLCNLTCEICPVAKKILNRPSRNMPISEFKTIVDDIRDYALLLVLWDWGEPFMNPELPDMIAYASAKEIRTVTSTNAHFLRNTDYVEAILKAGLSTLIIAMDSLEKDTYARFRRNGNLDSVLEGLQKLIEIKQRIGAETKIHIRMVVTRHNEHEICRMRRFAKALGADWFSVKSVNINLDIQAKPEDLEPRNPRYRRFRYKRGTWERFPSDAPCHHIWNIANINVNGDVVGCCYDYDASMKSGNVFEEPLTQIWNGPRFRQLRKTVYTNRKSLPRCSVCMINYELSNAGWFPYFTSLKETRRQKLQKLLKRFKQFRKAIRSTVAWQTLRRTRKRFLGALLPRP